MSIEWKYVKPLNDKKSVSAFLIEHSIVLPLDLVKVLESYNGGRPSDKSVVVADGREFVFKSLLSYNKDDLETIYSIYPIFEQTSCFPFATDPSGNIICYDTEKEEYVLYEHETDSYVEIVSMKAIINK